MKFRDRKTRVQCGLSKLRQQGAPAWTLYALCRLSPHVYMCLLLHVLNHGNRATARGFRRAVSGDSCNQTIG